MFRSNEINHKDNWRKVSRRTEEFTAQNAPTVADYEYTYSKGLHLIGKQENEENRRTAYQYDSYYRLRRVDYDCDYTASDPTCIESRNNVFKCDSSETDCEDFYQDGVHNIEQSTENGVTYAWGVDKLNRLRDKKVGGNTAVTYKYDERNNMIGEDFDGSEPADISYIYDDLNRLIEVKDGSNNTIAAYTYDAFNRRITKTVGNTTERYSYDDWDIIEISTNSNNYTNIIDSGTDRHIAIEVTANNVSTLYYFLTDERGNVTALTDASGNVLERYRYRVYGDFEILDSQFTPKNCSNQTCYATNLHNFLWGGSLYEPETNLYWMRNRYYHIDMHRFINQDPIGIWGDANNLGNGFAYVAGMVIEASDPSGLKIAKYDTSCNVNAITYETENNSVVAELWNMAEISTYDLYIFCDNDKNVGSFTYKYDKKEMSQNYMMVIGGKGNLSLAEKLAHELTHFIYHKFIINAPNIGDLKDFLKQIQQDLKKEKDTNKSQILKEVIDKLKKLIEELEKAGEEAENEAVAKQKEAKAEEEEKKKKGGEKYPSDPDSSEDKSQSYFANQFIKKIFEMREKKSLFEIMEEEGPVIKYEDNGRRVFIFNPYYRGKDPMKQIFWKTKNADGTNGFVKNPFTPGAEYGYDSTTYEKFQQSGFPQTNVDPYFN